MQGDDDDDDDELLWLYILKSCSMVQFSFFYIPLDLELKRAAEERDVRRKHVRAPADPIRTR